MKIKIKHTNLEATERLAGVEPGMLTMRGKEYRAERHNAGSFGVHYRAFGGDEYGQKYGWIFHTDDVEVIDATGGKIDHYDDALKELENLSIRLHGGYCEPKSERDQVLGSLIKTIVDKHKASPLEAE